MKLPGILLIGFGFLLSCNYLPSKSNKEADSNNNKTKHPDVSKGESDIDNCKTLSPYNGCIINKVESEELFVGAYGLRFEKHWDGISANPQFIDSEINFSSHRVEWGKIEKIRYDAITFDRGEEIQDAPRFNTIYKVVEVKESKNIKESKTILIRTINNFQDYEVKNVAEQMSRYFKGQEKNYYYISKKISFVSATVKHEFEHFIQNICIADIDFELSPAEDSNTKLTILEIKVGSCHNS